MHGGSLHSAGGPGSSWFAVREWWKGVVHVEQPSLQDAGMEKLTIRFK